MKDTQTNNHKWTAKRIVALIGVFFLVAIYIASLFISLLIPERADDMLLLCIFGTVAIPLLIWIYVWMYGKLTGKRTIADVDYLQSKENFNNDTESADTE